MPICLSFCPNTEGPNFNKNYKDHSKVRKKAQFEKTKNEETNIRTVDNLQKDWNARRRERDRQKKYLK